MTQSTSRRRGLYKLAILMVMFTAGILAFRLTPLGELLTREGVIEGIEYLRSSPLAPFIFVPLYAVAVSLAVPGTLATLAGGAVFGLWWGTLFNWLGASIGANLAYALARFLGRQGVSDLLGDRAGRWPAMERLDRAVQTHGFRGMLTLRLIPVVPFNALNFGGGLVGMGWPKYALSTGLGIIPGTFVYTMFADALLEGSTEASREALIRMTLAGFVLVALSFLPSLMKRLHLRLPGEEEAQEVEAK